MTNDNTYNEMVELLAQDAVKHAAKGVLREMMYSECVRYLDTRNKAELWEMVKTNLLNNNLD